VAVAVVAILAQEGPEELAVVVQRLAQEVLGVQGRQTPVAVVGVRREVLVEVLLPVATADLVS
jgi:hypothetical protein